MDPLRLLWIIPGCVLVEYLFEYFCEVNPQRKTDQELQSLCRACWHKWTLGIQMDEPELNGVWRREDFNHNEDT